MLPKLSIVLPTYNERDNIVPMVEKLDNALRGIDWEAIFVDDNSPDNTAQKVREIAMRDRRIRCISRIGRRGLSGACIEGILAAAADIVVVMDADLQHDETKLPKMLSLVESGDADLVVCSRFIETDEEKIGLSKARVSGSKIANTMARQLLGTKLTDPMSGFFMIRRVEVEKIVPKLSKQGFKILLDILATTRSQLRVREISAEFRERLHGESKLDTMIALEFLGLLVSKLTNDLVSVRFFLFCLVGSIGLILHLIVLRMVILLEFASFGIAQLIATFVAMSSNYILNNVLTYRDSRLKGGKFVRGLLGFYLVCSLGVFANVGVANFVYTFGSIWWLAGTIGVLIGAFWNYAASNFLVWRR